MSWKNYINPGIAVASSVYSQPSLSHPLVYSAALYWGFRLYGLGVSTLLSKIGSNKKKDLESPDTESKHTAYIGKAPERPDTESKPYTSNPRATLNPLLVKVNLLTPSGLIHYMDLDCIPKEIDMDSQAELSNLKIIGRNTGVYHYGGSEDTLTLELLWYSGSTDSLTVYQKCVRMENLTKSNGNQPPPVIQIVWGGDNNVTSLLRGVYFIVEKAPYTISNFHMGYIEPGGTPRAYGEIRGAHAKQSLILKRVSPNQLIFRYAL